MDYDGTGVWAIATDVTLPPPAGVGGKADAGILNGGFDPAGHGARRPRFSLVRGVG